MTNSWYLEEAGTGRLDKKHEMKQIVLASFVLLLAMSAKWLKKQESSLFKLIENSASLEIVSCFRKSTRDSCFVSGAKRSTKRRAYSENAKEAREQGIFVASSARKHRCTIEQQTRTRVNNECDITRQNWSS